MPNTSRWNDEWWTTQQVLGFLKLKRKALWELREKPERGFPAPARFGGKFNLYPAADIRLWAESQMRGTRSRPAPEKRTLKSARSPEQAPLLVTSQTIVVSASTTEATTAPVSIASQAVTPRASSRRKKHAPNLNQLDLFG